MYPIVMYKFYYKVYIRFFKTHKVSNYQNSTPQNYKNFSIYSHMKPKTSTLFLLTYFSPYLCPEF